MKYWIIFQFLLENITILEYNPKYARNRKNTIF